MTNSLTAIPSVKKEFYLYFAEHHHSEGDLWIDNESKIFPSNFKYEITQQRKRIKTIRKKHGDNILYNIKIVYNTILDLIKRDIIPERYTPKIEIMGWKKSYSFNKVIINPAIVSLLIQKGAEKSYNPVLLATLDYLRLLEQEEGGDITLDSYVDDMTQQMMHELNSGMIKNGLTRNTRTGKALKGHDI